MTRINTNVPSLVAQNRLRSSNNDLQEALTRLSTGLRINKGSDDPAGLIASEALRSEITSLNKALSNTRRADQIIATADSALSQVSNLLNDVRGLVVEAANTGGLSQDEIDANQLQVDSSLEAINRIAQTTTFQGRKLLDGSLDFLTNGGSNFDKISGLKVDQASLGTAGSVAVDVEVVSVATKARVDVANIPAGGDAGSGTITLTNRAANGEAATAAQTLAGGGAFTVSAKDGGGLDGTAGNSATVSIVSGETTALTNSVTALQSTAAGDYNIAVKSSSTTYAGSKGNALDVTIQAGNTATAQAVSSAQDVNGTSGAFQIRAKAGGAYDGVAGNVITFDVESGVGATDAVAVAANHLQINVDNSNSLSLADLKAALEADGDFNADFEIVIAEGAENALFRNDGSDDITGAALNGASSGTDAVATFSQTGDSLTITVDDNTARNLSDIKAAIDADATFAADFEFNIGVDDVFRTDGSDDAAAVAFAGGTNEVAEATRTGDALTITVSDAAAQSLANIKTALASDSDFDDFELNITTAGNFANDGSDDKNDVAFSGGTDSTLDDVISITGPSGESKNGTITINQSSSVSTPTASVDENGNITVTVNDTTTSTLASIASSIGSLSGYSATVSSTAGDAVFDPTKDTLADTDITGATDGGLTSDVVFELSGKTGTEVFNVSKGTSIDQLVSQINLVSDATGISANANSGTLELSSSEYGSDAFVDLRVVSEDPAGTFTQEIGAGSRATGADVTAKVNGVDATTKGNKISINTSTLDLSMNIEASFSGTASFTVDGGGAMFQLGPDVVTNQQARIGVGSVNTSRLGGPTGKLFELGSGESASLTTNPGRAAQIVDEAITNVTSLRGRLGAFQRTTLESNTASLNETVANLQEAESSIRDADFAAESARLTRAQILVQSGTNVLSMANQNPQNVLSLLR